MSYRKYGRARWSRAGAVVVALGAAAVVGIGAGARAPGDDASSIPRVASGVTVAGVDVAGFTRREAEAALAAAFAAPLVLRHRGERWRFAPQTLGARPAIARAARRALRAAEGETLAVRVRLDRRRLERFAAAFAHAFDRRPRSADVRLDGLRPLATEDRPGRRLERSELETDLAAALRAGDRAPIELVAKRLRPRVARSDLRLAVVIRRTSNRLFLYRHRDRARMRLVRKFRVATGQPSYPTPLGSFTIVTKQRDPWWYPPDSDWAAGAQPVPPGPGNPLGTRWMGLSEPLIGIHGTPDAASIGYSASHGCIRMKIPEAEWLFRRVEVGTPVFILAA